MYLKVLKLTNFKNYEEAQLDFSAKVNCFCGNNGVGKTNILDAIHYLSLTKSFFCNVDGTNIKHGEDYFIIDGTFDVDDDDVNIYCAFQKMKQKVLKRDGKAYSKLADHIGKFPVVMISPADSSLITDGSEVRRRFLNKIVSQYDNLYLDTVTKYNKALQQRNKLLKSFNMGMPFDIDLVKMWDLQLVKYGSYIHEVRRSVVDEMIPVFQRNYDVISDGKEKVKLSYTSHLDSVDFDEALSQSIEKDRWLEYTTVGVHKDDIILEMNDYPVKVIGSQGQQKSFLVALKLAKYEYIRGKCGVSPILLLDDIFDKFDRGRVEQIMKLVVDDFFGQVFITDTHEDRLVEMLESHNATCKFFRIDHNIVEQQSINS